MGFHVSLGECNIRIPIIISINGRGLINYESTLCYLEWSQTQAKG